MARLSILNVFGKNIAATEGSECQIHRKVTAAAFNESTNETVWNAALQQAAEMLSHWTYVCTNRPVRTISKNTRTFALNVLAPSLFSKSYGFSGAVAKEEIYRHDLSIVYPDSFSTVLNNIIPLFIFGIEILESMVDAQALGSRWYCSVRLQNLCQYFDR